MIDQRTDAVDRAGILSLRDMKSLQPARQLILGVRRRTQRLFSCPSMVDYHFLKITRRGMRDMSNTAITVLDHIDNISVPGNVFERPSNEFWALMCLQHGLEFLYHQAVKCDQVAMEGLGLQEGDEFGGIGNVPGLNRVPKTLLTCAFHWYAVTACNYAKVVGAIAHRQDSSRPLPGPYVEKVMPEVVAFRDKVAAHFAWATRNSKDNEGERIASILPPLSFVGNSFEVGAFVVGLGSHGKHTYSQAIAQWSIRKVHERLRLRYWPQQKREDGAA
jgi:hypothetical protein